MDGKIVDTFGDEQSFVHKWNFHKTVFKRTTEPLYDLLTKNNEKIGMLSIAHSQRRIHTEETDTNKKNKCYF